ncbi:MAG: bifunctional phosphopantothenoylcysteine decarboxylase/phosphopantothenate--cysteine ligase CoaBC [Candidatus Cloacimonadaceae bacterium]|jgi:phosphopantothenoylcysteine decarboxylase/phosphopantothenate--cysteine ligase|nr:bifunctional phosphopantothenoylcysteine decarboxylase/phosphopantothenate--cysteine ligase CoaBC [Candidatus Cloacimonadota bacterium]MDY0111995.1 bifunctional phosphopantothenoylcysteine decarboxylase/phosphopantothenate--cysteine ligase CoaBC [Candidatus Syntrophosphaera sp.]
MKGKILLCVTGGIAAYKAIDLASQLTKSGFEVKIALTKNAQRFVSALSFSAIINQGVHTNLFENSDPIPHIHLADWADLTIVAPATANIIAKAAQGIGDDLVSTILLSQPKPVLFVPAMNVHIYEHPATQNNLKILKERGNYILEPETGLLACGYEGKGKYPPNEEVIYAIRCYLKYPANLTGKKILVTAGATAEPIDPMRMITNKSSGKMGLSIARAFALRGAEVTLVYGIVTETIPYYMKKSIFAPTAKLMYDAVMKQAKNYDIIVQCAAVSDYKPIKASTQKIKKSKNFNLELIATPDILEQLGKNKFPKQKLIGFAAESEHILENAKEKLQKKNLDLICANNLETAGKDETTLNLIRAGATKTTKPIQLTGNKFDVALDLVEHIISL